MSTTATGAAMIAGVLTAAALGAVLTLPPAGAQTPPLPPPRVTVLHTRVVALQPRIISVAPQQTAPNTFTVNSDVLFAFDVATLSPDAQAVLGSVVHQLQSAPAGTVNIAGYTDSIGDAAYNITLSRNRAAAVQTFLQANVNNPALTYQAQGFGEASPVAPNTLPNGQDNSAGRQQNRRVVITSTPG